MTRYTFSRLIEGERYDTDYDRLSADGIAALAGSSVESHPYLTGPGFVARLAMSSRRAKSAKPEWSIRFDRSTDGYKTREVIIGEHAGVRYASHRKGYVASRTAFRKFPVLCSKRTKLSDSAPMRNDVSVNNRRANRQKLASFISWGESYRQLGAGSETSVRLSGYPLAVAA